MTKAYSEAKQEVMKMKKEAKKEKKKTASQVNISTPVNKSKLHELCRSLQADNEVGRIHKYTTQHNEES